MSTSSKTNSNRLKFFAPCPRGLEVILGKELADINAEDVQTTDGGVHFSGSLKTLYQANLISRTASRILWQVAHGKINNEQDVYELAKKVPWHTFFTLEQTFKVKVEGKGARVKSLNFTGLKIKDALCDEFRDALNARPNVAKHFPDVRVYAFLNASEAFLFVDSSGEALFKRGYREEAGPAPLRENLAAGLLLLAGFDGTQALLDPMAGSGTIVIEAALIAKNQAVGLNRHFGFEKLSSFDPALLKQLKEEAKAAIRPCVANICASDVDKWVLKEAIQNAKFAQVAECIEFSHKDVLDTRPQAESGMIVTNPPYGVRLEDEEKLAVLYPQLGSWLKQYFAGWCACILTADPRMVKLMRLSPKRKHPLFNGAIECRLFEIKMVAGSNRKEKKV